jgi:hypothetical protein
MKCSSVLAFPTVTYPHHKIEEGSKTAYAGFLTSGETINAQLFAACFEDHVRTMISSCACKILFPAYTHTCWATPKRLKSLMGPTLKRRVSFVDRHNHTWNSVLNYFASILAELPLDRMPGCKPVYPDALLLLGRVASDFYHLVLATRFSCEAPILPGRTVHMIRFLLSSQCSQFLSSESKNRLSVLEGIFALYQKKDEIPAFTCAAPAGYSFSERIEEIMDDAELLQASRIRKFFSVASNLRSVRRDLRAILASISKNSKWAKGVHKS